MSAKGCCWDNAVVESFFSTLKLELNFDDDREVLISPLQLQRDLAFCCWQWRGGSRNPVRNRSLNQLCPASHPLRRIRKLVDRWQYFHVKV